MKHIIFPVKIGEYFQKNKELCLTSHELRILNKFVIGGILMVSIDTETEQATLIQQDYE